MNTRPGFWRVDTDLPTPEEAEGWAYIGGFLAAGVAAIVVIVVAILKATAP